MWIRSQDKLQLISASDIRIVPDGINNFLIKSGSFVLGEYSTKEIVLNILSQMETFIIRNNNVPFEMPKNYGPNYSISYVV